MMAPKTTETKHWLQPLILGTYTVFLGFTLTYGIKFISQVNTLATTVVIIQESQQRVEKRVEKIEQNGTTKDIQQDSRIDAVSEKVDAIRRQNRESEEDRFTYEGILPDRKYIQNERNKNRRTK